MPLLHLFSVAPMGGRQQSTPPGSRHPAWCCRPLMSCLLQKVMAVTCRCEGFRYKTGSQEEFCISVSLPPGIKTKTLDPNNSTCLAQGCLGCLASFPLDSFLCPIGSFNPAVLESLGPQVLFCLIAQKPLTHWLVSDMKEGEVI